MKKQLLQAEAIKAWEAQRNENLRMYKQEKIKSAEIQAKHYTHRKLLKHHCSDKAKTAAYCRSDCMCVCVWGLALSIQEGYEVSVTSQNKYEFTINIESEDKYIMNKCKYYNGTEKVSPTATKIKCSAMPEKGRVFENKDEEGKEIVSCCWNGGGHKCPYYYDDIAAASPESDPEQLSLLGEEDTTAITAVTEQADRTLAEQHEQKAVYLHHRIITNGQIAAESIVAMAKDLRIMRDEKLYTYLGCADFNDYCEKQVGIKQRHAYNFIKVLDKYGENQLTSISHLGIAKLVELTALDEEDRQQLIESGEAEELSVRELKAKIEELTNRCEQLTLDLDDEVEDKDNAVEQIRKLEAQIAEMKTAIYNGKSKLTEAKHQADNYKAEAERIEAENKRLDGMLKSMQEDMTALENRPVEIAVEKPTDEDIEKYREEGRAEAQAAAARAQSEAEERIRAEYESKIAVLQSNAKSMTPPDGKKERIKFHLEECQRSFNAALDVIKDVEDEEAKSKFIKAMRTVVAKMQEVLSDE